MSGNLPQSPIVVYAGDNRLEIQERIQSAREQIDPTSLSTSIFDNARSSIPEIVAAVGSPGFFGADRLVICHDLIGPGTGRKRSSKKSDDAPDERDCVRSVAPGVRLILVEQSIAKADERRLLAEREDIEFVSVEVPRGRGLIDWACNRARTHGASLDGANAAKLVEALFPGFWREKARRDDVPPDLTRLDTELNKLATAAGDHGEITADLIATLVPSADALDIWGLSNAIADRDQRRAINQLELAIENGQAPEMILAQLAAQFETFAVVSAAKGLPAGQVATRTGLTEGRLRQASRTAKNYSRAELARALCQIRRTDFGIKQGWFEPADALASLVAELARTPR